MSYNILVDTTAKTSSLDKWRKALLPADTSLKSAISNLVESALQIILVVSKEGILLGTITDGDIRRGLLRGAEMNSPIEKIMHRDAFVAPVQLSREIVLQIMQVNGIHQLPVVDEKRTVVGLHLWNEIVLPQKISNIMVIMAGGQGTRLRPHTEKCPKPMLHVAGRPMLEHIIERARREGFHRFVLAIHYLGHMIVEYFGDGGRWNVQVEYLREKSPLGTAGALSQLLPVPTAPFLVTNGDVMTDIHYNELLDYHYSHRASATMAVRLHEWQHPFGVVKIKGIDITGFAEKPISRSYINAGIYVLEPSVLNSLNPEEPCDMPTLFDRLRANSARTIVYPMHEPWLDVGRPADLELADSANAQK